MQKIKFSVTDKLLNNGNDERYNHYNKLFYLIVGKTMGYKKNLSILIMLKLIHIFKIAFIIGLIKVI